MVQSPHYSTLSPRLQLMWGSIVPGSAPWVLYPFVIMAIKREGPGPIFYRQERVGQYNNPIKILKFRTMTGTDDSKSALDTKLTITKVGGFLRKTRIDELPQLWNVFKGDLSFIAHDRKYHLSLVCMPRRSYHNMRHRLNRYRAGLRS